MKVKAPLSHMEGPLGPFLSILDTPHPLDFS